MINVDSVIVVAEQDACTYQTKVNDLRVGGYVLLAVSIDGGTYKAIMGEVVPSE